METLLIVPAMMFVLTYVTVWKNGYPNITVLGYASDFETVKTLALETFCNEMQDRAKVTTWNVNKWENDSLAIEWKDQYGTKRYILSHKVDRC